MNTSPPLPTKSSLSLVFHVCVRVEVVEVVFSSIHVSVASIPKVKSFFVSVSVITPAPSPAKVITFAPKSNVIPADCVSSLPAIIVFVLEMLLPLER